MNRTYLLTRRTLLCAVFVCPLALLSPWLSAAAQALFSLYSAAYLPSVVYLWKKRRESPVALMRRMLFPCFGALFAGYFPRFTLLMLFPGMHFLTLKCITLLSAFTALWMQCMLLRLFPYERKEHKYLALISAVFFIVCTLSVG